MAHFLNPETWRRAAKVISGNNGAPNSSAKPTSLGSFAPNFDVIPGIFRSKTGHTRYQSVYLVNASAENPAGMLGTHRKRD
jgi:hypothetical protein